MKLTIVRHWESSAAPALCTVTVQLLYRILYTVNAKMIQQGTMQHLWLNFQLTYTYCTVYCGSEQLGYILINSHFSDPDPRSISSSSPGLRQQKWIVKIVPYKYLQFLKSLCSLCKKPNSSSDAEPSDFKANNKRKTFFSSVFLLIFFSRKARFITGLDSGPRRLIRSSRPTEIFQPPKRGFFSVHAQLQLLGNIFQLFAPHLTSPQLTSHLTMLH